MKNHLSGLLAIDVETSGPDPFLHQLLAFALVPCDRSLPPLEVYVRHESMQWSEVGQRYFELYKTKWDQQAVTPAAAFKRLERYLSTLPPDMMLVGHNVGFDFSFLKQLLGPAQQSWFSGLSHRSVDTHSLLEALVWLGRVAPSACSSTGAFDHFNIHVPDTERHTALGDAVATAELARSIFAEFDSIGDEIAENFPTPRYAAVRHV